jgi:hypothetical protein
VFPEVRSSLAVVPFDDHGPSVYSRLGSRQVWRTPVQQRAAPNLPPPLVCCNWFVIRPAVHFEPGLMNATGPSCSGFGPLRLERPRQQALILEEPFGETIGAP